MSDIISVRNLSKVFHVPDPKEKSLFKRSFRKNQIQVTAVDNISFNIVKGSTVGFVGANGAGKTTTLKMLTGTLYPSSGSVVVDNYIPYKRDVHFRKEIALVMGNKPQLILDLSALDYFELIRSIYDLPKATFHADIARLTRLLNVERKLNQQVRKLSLGEKMKMEFISAAIIHPNILFLDEPTIGLDVQSKRDIRKFLVELNRQEKTTILLTSHDMEDISETCQDLIIINNGKVVLSDTVKNTIANYSDYKYLKVRDPNFSEADLATLDKIELISWNHNQAVLKIKKDEVFAMLSYLTQLFLIEDFEIKNFSLEEIVLNNYSARRINDE